MNEVEVGRMYVVGGKSRRKEISRWVDNIKTNLGEMEWGGLDWIILAQDWDHWRALVNAKMNLPVPYNAGKFLSGRLHKWWSVE
jgi:hypothetical protein